jgi:hypothetical protein
MLDECSTHLYLEVGGIVSTSLSPVNIPVGDIQKLVVARTCAMLPMQLGLAYPAPNDATSRDGRSARGGCDFPDPSRGPTSG